MDWAKDSGQRDRRARQRADGDAARDERQGAVRQADQAHQQQHRNHGGGDGEQRQRIVSVNLCADAYLMAMADKTQIAALSPFSRDPSFSYYYRQARAYPGVRGNAEAVLALKPALVLGSPYLNLEDPRDARPLRRAHVDAGEVKKNFAGIEAQTRSIAAVISHSDRGEKLVGELQAQLAPIASPRAPLPVAVHYQRQGYVAGTGTLMDDMMRRARVQNLAARLGNMQLAHIDLETIITARPDYIIFTTEPGEGRDWGALLLSHPALAHAIAGRTL